MRNLHSSLMKAGSGVQGNIALLASARKAFMGLCALRTMRADQAFGQSPFSNL